MRNSELTKQEFGPFHNPSFPLQPGMEQCMQFSEHDIGPCYFSPAERNERRFDKYSGKKRKHDLVKSVLIENLKAFGLDDPKG